MAEDIFARIRNAAKKVNARADAVTAEIASIEERLQAAGAGVDVEDDVCFHTERRSQSEPLPKDNLGVVHIGTVGVVESTERTFMVEDRYSLAYARVGDRFRVAYMIDTFAIGGFGSQIDQDGPYPLADSDRQTRLRAEGRLAHLVEHIASALEELNQGTSATKKS